MVEIIRTLMHYLAIILQHAMSVFPINSKKVIVINYYGKGYGDNGKYIVEELLDIDSSYTIVWPVRNNTDISTFPQGIKIIKYYSFSFFYHLASAGTWISNVRLPWFFVKRPNQYYIQIWHGNNAIKRVEKDTVNSLAPRYIKSAKHDSKIADLMTSNSEWWTKLIKRAFWYEGEVVPCGVPRLKTLYDNKEKRRELFLKKVGLPEDTHIALYAPTFRSDFKTDHYILDYEEVRKACEDSFGGEWIIGLRLHPNLAKIENVREDKDVLEFTNYPDLYEILTATDLLITDYSSIMFEAGFAGINVVLYARDIPEYLDDRGFYFDITKMPYPLTETENELIHAIKNWDKCKYHSDNEKFKEMLGIKEDGKGAAIIAKKITSHSKE